jgi:HAD superfamily hydrolase (TIGR01549 family)
MSRPSPLTTVFLDAGGVLVNPNWERVAGALRQRGVSASGSRLASAEPHAKLELDVPAQIRATDDRSRSALYWELVLRHAGIVAAPELLAGAWIELEEYHRRANLWETVIDGVPDALDRLRALGLKLVVVSNSNGTLREKFRRLDLERRFDLVIDSHEVGVEKPNPRIFELAIERAGVKREAVVHVGDFYEIDVVGAHAAGIRAVLIDPAGLHVGKSCPRLESLRTLAEAIEQGKLFGPENPPGNDSHRESR